MSHLQNEQLTDDSSERADRSRNNRRWSDDGTFLMTIRNIKPNYDAVTHMHVVTVTTTRFFYIFRIFKLQSQTHNLVSSNPHISACRPVRPSSLVTRDYSHIICILLCACWGHSQCHDFRVYFDYGRISALLRINNRPYFSMITTFVFSNCLNVWLCLVYYVYLGLHQICMHVFDSTGMHESIFKHTFISDLPRTQALAHSFPNEYNDENERGNTWIKNEMLLMIADTNPRNFVESSGNENKASRIICNNFYIQFYKYALV